MATKIFNPQADPNPDYVEGDGKVKRFQDTNNIIELNSDSKDHFPQFPINYHLPMQNILFDKINAPFIATGYEIFFD